MRHNILATLMFTQPVTVYEMIKFNLSNWSVFESYYHQRVGQYHELQRHWMAMAKKWRIYLKLFRAVNQ